MNSMRLMQLHYLECNHFNFIMCSVGFKNGFQLMKNLEATSLVPHQKYYAALLYPP